MSVYLWAVVHDRPTEWACEPDNWPDELWPGRLPSQSTMSRRLRTTEVNCVLANMEGKMIAIESGGFVKVVDGKPLLVGSHSKDPDAHWGRVRRGWARGYKFHAVYDTGSVPLVWDVVALNEAEPVIAARMLPSLRRGGGYLLGDKSYDSNALHDIALRMGCQLVAQRKRPHCGLGHRRHSPGRLRSIALLQQDFGQKLYAFREQIERKFGWLTNHGGGLAPLPNWVRRLPRVRQWIQAKLLIHATYVSQTSRSPPLANA